MFIFSADADVNCEDFYAIHGPIGPPLLLMDTKMVANVYACVSVRIPCADAFTRE